MVDRYEVVESRHRLQNPTSPDKIRLLGEQLRLDRSTQVLDVAGGHGGPAVLLAQQFGCRVTSVELRSAFAAAAREHARAAGVGDLVDVVEADAKEFRTEQSAYDTAVSLGASFAFGGLVPTVQALVRAVPAGAFVAVGEPFWRSWPLPTGFEPADGEDLLPLRATVERLESAGEVELVSLIASSHDDRDRYDALHWSTLDDWLRAKPDDPQADEFRDRARYYRDRYLGWTRELLGWAIFVCRVA